MVLGRRFALTLLGVGCFSTVGACGSGAGVSIKEPAEAKPARPVELPEWCGAVDGALGKQSEVAGEPFHCLAVPNFLVTGFYGSEQNPERSDFVNGCFAGKQEAAERLRMSVRPVGNLSFNFTTTRSLDAGAGLDLSFLGPWAPRLSVQHATRQDVEISVELRDAEIRVLSSVAEILGQEYQLSADKPEARASLEPCITSLCDGKGERQVYTAKVLAAVPVIRVRLDAKQSAKAEVALAAGVAGFELSQRTAESGTIEIRGTEKLNVAALLQETRAAFERAGTCQRLRATQARAKMTLALRELGLQTVAGRELAGVSSSCATLRKGLQSAGAAFSDHEQSDLQKSLEALESAAATLAESKPSRKVCDTRKLVEVLLSGGGGDNQLHALVLDVAQPLHQRLTDLANDNSLPCAEPVWYFDYDRDGFGDKKKSKRAADQPPGYVANSLDCYDSNPEARPGQAHYFSEHRGDGSYDYDCDSKQQIEDNTISGGCQEISTLGIVTRCWADAGWQKKAPACGQKGRWLAGCQVSTFSCSTEQEEQRQARCR